MHVKVRTQARVHGGWKLEGVIVVPELAEVLVWEIHLIND